MATTRVEDPAGCDSVLIMNFDSSRFDSNTELHALDLVTEASFKKILSQSGGGGGISFAGLSFGGSANFINFSQQRTQLFAQKKFQSNQAVSREKIRYAVPPVAIAAWSACKANAVQPGVGFIGRITNNDPTMLHVTFRWLPAPGIGDLEISDSVVTGATALLGGVNGSEVIPQGAKIIVNGEFSQQFRRDPTQPFALTVNTVQGDSVVLDLPAFNDVFTPNERKPVKPTRVTIISTASETIVSLLDDDAKWFMPDRPAGFPDNQIFKAVELIDPTGDPTSTNLFIEPKVVIIQATQGPSKTVNLFLSTPIDKDRVTFKVLGSNRGGPGTDGEVTVIVQNTGASGTSRDKFFQLAI